MQVSNFVGESRGVFPQALYDAHYKLYQTDLAAADNVLLDSLKQVEITGKLPSGCNETQSIESDLISAKLWLTGGLCEVSFWKFLFQESDENKEELEKRLADAEEIASKMYNDNNIHTWFSFFETSATKLKFELFIQSIVGYGFYYLIYSIYHYRLQKTISGTYYFRKSWKYFEQAVSIIQEQKKNNFTPQIEITGTLNFGIAIFHLLLSLVPPSFQGLITVIGFEGNRASAMHELSECVKSQVPRAAESALLLAITKKFLLDDEEGYSELFSGLTHLYPDSALICYTTGFIARITGDLDKSIHHFVKTQQYAKAQNSTQLVVTASYHIGYSYFMLNDFDKVIENYEQFLAISVTETQKRFRPFASFMLGFSYWMSDVKKGINECTPKIEPLFKKAQDWLRMHESFDKFAKRKMDEFCAKQKFDELDIFQHKIGALVEGKQYERAKHELLKYESLIFSQERKEKDYEGLYYFYLGSCQMGLLDYDQAQVILNKAISLESEIVSETFIVPYCWLLLGEIQMKLNNFEKANEDFLKCKSYSDYDWHKLVAVRLYSNNQKLNILESKNEK